jgi:hypothetical protein
MLTRGAKIGILAGVLAMLLGIIIPAAGLWWMLRPRAPKAPLQLKFDATGPCVVLATRRAAADYAPAIDKAMALHAGAERIDFDAEELDSLLERLQILQPRYALVFIQPDELDVNFGWRWLTMTSRIDADPFVDLRTGFITGATPQTVQDFVERIAAAAAGQTHLPGALVDDLGPPEQGTQTYFNTFTGAPMLPAEWDRRFTARSISHGRGSFTDDRLDALQNAGLVHFGGHGHPDRIDDGLTAGQLSRLSLAPCVVFNGACYTGVTRRWFDQMTGSVAEKDVAAENCFCLKLLEKKEVVAYLAALHPDHGMPVYQEMEFLACQGASLGDVIKHTYDGVVLGAGGKLPAFEPLRSGDTSQSSTPADVMLKGTAARILFGDPALVVCDPILAPPFSVTTVADGDSLRVTATVSNAGLKSTFTDTYQNDLSPQAPFNDRALFVVKLPDGWTTVSAVEAVAINAGRKPLAHRLVGYAIEQEGSDRRLHVQIDVAADGFQKSPLRSTSVSVEFLVKP